MRARIFAIIAIVAVLAGLVGVTTSAQAAAYGASFTTSIVYQNLGAAEAVITVYFYSASNPTVAIPIPLSNLPASAGSSVSIGGLSGIGSGFTGSAVMSSSQPLAVTLVQVPGAATGIKSRPMTNGMGPDAAASFVQIPTVLKNTFGSTSVFNVQNAGLTAIDGTVKFFPAGGGTVVTKNISALPVGAEQTFDLGQMADWASFNGSVQINVTTAGGSVVATDIEYATGGNKAYGFEGTAASGATVYMPSALCNYGPTLQNSAYAVQNTNTSGDVLVTVTYKSTGGNIYTEPVQTIAAGAKKSFPGCGISTTLTPAGFIGSATITATGGNIVAIGKVSDSQLGTAFLGFTSGAAKIALPYVRWGDNTNWLAGSRQRSYIAIQNIGGADLAAGTVTVKYYDNNGNLVGTHTLGVLAKGSKLSSNATLTDTALTSFGYYGGAIGGSAIVQGPAGSQLAVIVRTQTYLSAGLSAGEDYNGIPAS